MIQHAFWQNRLVSFLALTLAFGLVYALNNTLTAPLMVVPGAHLIHLPSGFKLLLVLIFAWTGALSIFTVSLLASIFFYFPERWFISLQLAAACALAPLLARKIAFEHLGIESDLSNLNIKRLFYLGMVFSALNSSFNQLVLFWNHVIDHFSKGFLIMFTGDITGVMMVIGLIRWGMKLVKPRLNGLDET
jgi:hypothetical protein